LRQSTEQVVAVSNGSQIVFGHVGAVGLKVGCLVLGAGVTGFDVGFFVVGDGVTGAGVIGAGEGDFVEGATVFGIDEGGGVNEVARYLMTPEKTRGMYKSAVLPENLFVIPTPS
jgi:hypothetical protein